jgi:flagellar hook-associated protein 1 FlgK
VFDIATAINQQHAAGVGLDGGGGRVLFDLGATSTGAARDIRLNTEVASNPDYVAAAATADELPGGSSNAVLLSSISTSGVVSGGRTPAEAYGDIVGQVGTLRAASKSDVDLRQGILQQAQTARESISGVSLDEEMVNLQKYQAAYQASSKLLTTVNGLLQDLIQSV